MNRALIIAAILVLLGGGYALYKGLTRIPAVSQMAPGVQVETASEKEETKTYKVDAAYPQFGLSAIDTSIKTVVEDAVSQFRNDVAAGPPPPDSAVSQYEFQSMFDSVYVGADVVSSKLVIATYMGGAHGNAVVYGLNYDRETGRALTLEDALTMIGLTLEEVAERAKKELSAELGADIIAPEGFDPTSENYATFIIDPDRVTFMFQLYQVAPYAAGMQEVSFERIQ